MKQANWNEYLSLQHPWTKRLIGIEQFSKNRNLEQIEREYNQDKYGTLTEFNFTDIELYKRKELELSGLSDNDKIFISLGEQLFETYRGLAFSIYYSTIANIIANYNPERICELGCGYGYNFSYLNKICPEIYGGEYSKNAVILANSIGLNIKEFNFYNLNDYLIIRKKSLVFTCHGVEQLPSAISFISGLYANKENIELVVNFEPTFLTNRTSLIGTLRNRYIEFNDYNRDLITLLMDRDDIDILEYHPDYIGLNPLHPTNIVVWRFK
ncbi:MULTISPECIES: hypothetical protein [Nostoc]|uniref:Class I SAM-dependent methyltransferase n=1 Tax=Nostoc paludosum FACHB-159 TaxID=2692908 RepID=A0ABR8KDF5_9NOSO|nr:MULTISPECIES: hypothetical protein [Nostoc]MBD2680427.1 hypothetical protein [Nostoc sp. FACHB-857]MBD2736816.1 hypothetical protein [Nostoc paludosum FACHB-159]